jgi:predicted nuclease of restriction endonuclease-like (RecB) superfamily
MMMYWHLGERIFVEEQHEQDRAQYGANLIKNIASYLESEFGSGFSVRQLELCRQFYRTYSSAGAVRPQLNWFQYRLLIRIDDEYKREYYELEAANQAWTGRELERQINSLLYERLLMSNDKESVLAVARKERIPERPTEIIKDPMYLEFLGLKRESEYYEKDIESMLINHLQEFLLELGNGFAFVARQKRILLEDDEFFADLVFFNRLLRCFVIIEIKTHKLTHEDLGQLQMYVNYYDRYEKLPDENPTVGILLCTAKNDLLARITLPEGNSNILTSKYQLYLPSENELLEEIKEVINLVDDIEFA